MTFMTRYDYHQKSIGGEYYSARPKRKKSKIWRVFLLCLFFAFVAALFIYVFPEVDVTVVPKTEAVENDFEVIIDAGLTKEDLVNNKFQGEIVEVEESLSKTFATTGEKNVGEKAAGEAVFFNQTGLAQPLTTQNKLVTDDGLVFYLKDNIEIPKAEVSAEGNIIYGNLVASIVAAEAGEEGNIPPGRLTIIDLPFSKQNKIYGEVKNKLLGGTNKVIRVVSADDLKNAQEKIVAELKPMLKKKIEAGLLAGQKLREEMVEYGLESVEKTVELEEEIENFEMKVTTKAKALTWDEDKVRENILKKIMEKTAGDKKLVQTSQDVFEVTVAEFDVNKGTAKLKIHARNQISLPLDLSALKDELKGKTEYEARRLLLSKDNIKDARFKFRYSITSKIPQNGNRINIILSF